jgi:hypothetical protein
METWIVVGMIVGFWWWVGGWLGIEIRCLGFTGFDRVVLILLGNGMRSCILRGDSCGTFVIYGLPGFYSAF